MSTKVFSTDTPTEVIRTAILPAEVVTYESGLEQRNRVWANPRWQFEVHVLYPLNTVVQSIYNFFIEHGGNYETFRYRPDLVTRVETAEVLGVGNGARTLFKIYGNLMSAASVYVSGAGTTYTVSLTNGTVTLAAAPASGAVVTADVSSELFTVRFQESLANGEYFFSNLVREQRFTLIQDKGLA